jgi:hypothetical protein
MWVLHIIRIFSGPYIAIFLSSKVWCCISQKVQLSSISISYQFAYTSFCWKIFFYHIIIHEYLLHSGSSKVRLKLKLKDINDLLEVVNYFSVLSNCWIRRDVIQTDWTATCDLISTVHFHLCSLTSIRPDFRESVECWIIHVCCCSF